MTGEKPAIAIVDKAATVEEAVEQALRKLGVGGGVVRVPKPAPAGEGGIASSVVRLRQRPGDERGAARKAIRAKTAK